MKIVLPLLAENTIKVKETNEILVYLVLNKNLYERTKKFYFANKGPSSQGYAFFPVVMYGCESWTVKKAEC